MKAAVRSGGEILIEIFNVSKNELMCILDQWDSRQEPRKTRVCFRKQIKKLKKKITQDRMTNVKVF